MVCFRSCYRFATSQLLMFIIFSVLLFLHITSINVMFMLLLYMQTVHIIGMKHLA